MHKITITIAKELVSIKHGVILENLRNIKDRILNGSKGLNYKLSKWNCRVFQSMLEYKFSWLTSQILILLIHPKPALSAQAA